MQIERRQRCAFGDDRDVLSLLELRQQRQQFRLNFADDFGALAGEQRRIAK